MLEIGRFNTLRVQKASPSTTQLDGGASGAITLDNHEPGEHFRVGDEVDVFVYLNFKGVLTATTQRPLAEVGQVAWLKIVRVNELGAFADWGLEKDLFIPFAEQQYDLNQGSHALVRIYIDNQNRIAGSTRLNRWLTDEAGELQVGEKVALIIADKTELGYKAVINHKAWGLLYANELYRPVRKGQAIQGFVKTVRKDQRIDLTLEKPGYTQGKIDVVAESIIDKLKEHEGRLLLTDKSSPEAIHALFGVSKRVFKQAVGLLYKQRRINLDAKSITLV